MSPTTISTRRVKTINDAAEALSLARDATHDAAERCSDLTGHDATIAKAKDLTSQIDTLLSDMQGRELLIQIDMEAERREAHEATAQNRREDEVIKRLDDCISEYREERECD